MSTVFPQRWLAYPFQTLLALEGGFDVKPLLASPRRFLSEQCLAKRLQLITRLGHGEDLPEIFVDRRIIINHQDSPVSGCIGRIHGLAIARVCSAHRVSIGKYSKYLSGNRAVI